MTFVSLPNLVMSNSYLFHFDRDFAEVAVPENLNDPFGVEVPVIAKIAAVQFQDFISKECKNWDYDFSQQRGKMFGVLVVQNNDGTIGFLGTMSGVFPGGKTCEKFVPSVFDTSTDNFFINKRMTELTEIGNTIKSLTNQQQINELTEVRKQKSHRLQQWLFKNYTFTTSTGDAKNIQQIFAESTHGNPPAASGECAAPKLLQYAYSYNFKPIAIAEFWWGLTSKNKEKTHLGFYPACHDKCKPILEFMLKNQ